MNLTYILSMYLSRHYIITLIVYLFIYLFDSIFMTLTIYKCIGVYHFEYLELEVESN